MRNDLTQTWVLFGGRWKIITDRRLVTLVLGVALSTWLMGLATGMLFMTSRYEQQEAALRQQIQREIQRQTQGIQREIKDLREDLRKVDDSLRSPHR
jgi:septal ring factor EnvC (AmiA/AmiB activator)